LVSHFYQRFSNDNNLAITGDHVASNLHIPALDTTVHWGYFSKKVEPTISVHSGAIVTIETLTHHAGDDFDRMIKDDPGAEAIFQWDARRMRVPRRGAGAVSGKLVNGIGEGRGVHLLTGPVHVEGAEPGDVLEVRILDVYPRPCCNAEFAGKSFGSNVAAAWGFHYRDLIEEPKPREVVTVYEFGGAGSQSWATAVYNYVWKPQTDPSGVLHSTYNYPGVVVDHSTVEKKFGILEDIQIPARLHFGTMGVAPKEVDYASSIPPSYTGGNVDDWRIGKGARVYYPVAVKGAMFSVGDPHAAQGDSELCGTAIEASLTGVFQFILHKATSLPGTQLEGLDYPLLETDDEWVVHGFSFPNYLAELGDDADQKVINKATLDDAMRDAFRKMRRFLMTTRRLSEDEAISLLSVAVDFGITQVVDGNLGVHATLKKSLFSRRKTFLPPTSR
jgi:acetamidase/formamidase